MSPVKRTTQTCPARTQAPPLKAQVRPAKRKLSSEDGAALKRRRTEVYESLLANERNASLGKERLDTLIKECKAGDLRLNAAREAALAKARAVIRAREREVGRASTPQEREVRTARLAAARDALRTQERQIARSDERASAREKEREAILAKRQEAILAKRQEAILAKRQEAIPAKKRETATPEERETARTARWNRRCDLARIKAWSDKSGEARSKEWAVLCESARSNARAAAIAAARNSKQAESRARACAAAAAQSRECPRTPPRKTRVLEHRAPYAPVKRTDYRAQRMEGCCSRPIMEFDLPPCNLNSKFAEIIALASDGSSSDGSSDDSSDSSSSDSSSSDDSSDSSSSDDSSDSSSSDESSFDDSSDDSASRSLPCDSVLRASTIAKSEYSKKYLQPATPARPPSKAEPPRDSPANLQRSNLKTLLARHSVVQRAHSYSLMNMSQNIDSPYSLQPVTPDTRASVQLHLKFNRDPAMLEDERRMDEDLNRIFMGE